MNHPDENASHFASDWLALREHADHRSRAHGLAALARRFLVRRSGRSRVIDLGAGRGSNLRYLNPRLGGALDWRLLDHDASLLAAVEPPGNAVVATEALDLSEPLAPLLAGAALVTTSALLDLTSAAWIRSLAAACAKTGAAVLVALTVNDRVTFSNPDPRDAPILAAIRRDQRRDKGLGPALGGAAPAVLINALSGHGYAITTQESNWRLARGDGALVRALIDGWAEAATRQRPRERQAVAAWAQRRQQGIAAGATRLTVGHVDVFAQPNLRRQTGAAGCARKSRS